MSDLLFDCKSMKTAFNLLSQAKRYDCDVEGYNIELYNGAKRLKHEKFPHAIIEDIIKQAQFELVRKSQKQVLKIAADKIRHQIQVSIKELLKK